ncbi:MAG TPA: DUF4384 domain-containing protein [Verrucomicrobiae bacterium]|nr:DUF4384 domain-containing protein [Verrucomicrobiae bacterium]
MLLTRGLVTFSCAAALICAQETSKRELTARELFYAATQKTTKPAQPAATPIKTDTSKTAPKTQPKEMVRPVRTQPKPVEIARTDTQEAGVRIIPTAAQTAPLPANGQPPLGLRINVMRYNDNGSTVDVPADTTFHSGDRIRLSVEPNAQGFLYVVNQGTSGTWRTMFPSTEIEGGDNRVEAMRPCVIPPGKHVFTFDATPGKEILFVVFSRQRVADLEDLIYSLKSGKKASEPETARSDRTLIMAANIGDPTIDRLRNAYSRDLIIEAVNPSTPGTTQEAAVYVVNPTGSEDSRVVADIRLVHQ